MSARVALAAGYFPAYARLPRKAQRKADEFIRKFTTDPKQPSIHYEPLRGAADSQLRSVRIGDDYRAIIRAPEQGDIFVLLWVDHHDEAYRWAQSKQVEVHPATGTMQVFDVDAASRALTGAEGDADEPDASDEVPYEEKRLFSDYSDEQLFSGGLPRPLIPAVRALYTDTDLDRLVAHLPQEAADLLTGLAAGYDYDAVIQQILDRPELALAPEPTKKPQTVPPPVDPSDLEAALLRESSQREFRLVDESFDLDKALTYPLDVWRVYLHPSQRKVVRAQTKGPVRVTGGAGTGKTVVVMHRAAFLVREIFKGPDDRVLVTTFTRNLAQDITDQLAKLLEPDELARIEIKNLDAWASQYLRDRGKSMRLATKEATESAWRSALDLYGVEGFDKAFCKSEWEHVVQEQELREIGTYARAIRKHRGTPLSRPDRRKLWELFEEYRSALESQGVAEAVDILRAARKQLEASEGPGRYRAVVVDETQDMGTEALRLIRTIAGPERPNDLFLVGDSHQRIYGRPAPLSHSGINIRGRRSHELRINYRTTATISRWAYRILGGEAYDDLDEGKVHGRGYVSLRHGNRPVVRHFENVAEEREYLVAEVEQLLGDGCPPGNICIVARMKELLTGGVGPALEKAGIDYELLERERPRRSSVRLATMHRVKGLEFSHVLVMSVVDGIMPLSRAVSDEDPVQAQLAETRERCLLYVAASRARDALYVTSYGERSPFLASLESAQVATSRETARPPSVASPSAETEAAAEQADPDQRGTLLAQPVASWPLPTRMQNWCVNRAIVSVQGLVEWSPIDLMSERNLGRKSVAETRKLIEDRFGVPWEELRRAPTGDGEAPSASELPVGWDALPLIVPDGLTNLPVVELKLPVRLTNYCGREGLTTLGELVAVPKSVLAEAKNMGRSSIKNGEKAIRDFIENLEARRAVWGEGLLFSWKRALQELDTIPRMVITRRAGLGGDAEILESIAETLGITRERVRQIEAKHNKRVRQDGAWIEVLRGRFETLLDSKGGAVAIEDLAGDSWWGGFEKRPQALAYFCERMLDGGYHVVEFEGNEYLGRVPKQELAESWRELRRIVEEQSFPVPLLDLETLARQSVDRIGETLARVLWEHLQGYLQIDDPSGEAPTAVAFGTGKEARILAILRAADAPVHISEIEAQIGRFVVPTEAMYFDRGTIGLEQHFPDFKAWLAKVVPAVVAIMESTGPGRQWSCLELINDVRDAIEIPDWMGHWHLSSLLRKSTEVNYLGRLRVVLPGVSDDGGRVQVREHFLQILREAGAPLGLEALLAKAAKSIDFGDVHARGLVLKPPFIRCDSETIGLVERDLPGGTQAMEEATEHLEAVLERRGRGMTAFQAKSEVATLGAAQAQWSEEMCLSVVRSEPVFRLSRAGNVGLSDWDTVRVPPRVELVKKSLEEGGGRVSVEAIQTRIEALYGARPARNDIGWMAFNAGAKLDGDWLVVK